MSFNLNEEIIDGHLVTAETKKLWAVELDLAKKLLEVCEKHNLRIWADGGTLLGAVRHKGFIPWDDDMDFVMFRDDYNRLMEIGPKEFKEPYFFQSIYTDNSWGGVAKLRRSDTAMIDAAYKDYKERNSGVFVDVFVLDGVPEDKEVFHKECRWVKKKRRRLTRYGLYKPDYRGWRAFLRTIAVTLYFKIRGYYKEQKRLVKRLSENKIGVCKKCSLIDFWATNFYDVNKLIIRDCKWYDNTILLPFCDSFLPAPKDYHKLLSMMYGDYVIPVKGRALHYILYVDPNRSYKEVINELKNR